MRRICPEQWPWSRSADATAAAPGLRPALLPRLQLAAACSPAPARLSERPQRSGRGVSPPDPPGVLMARCGGRGAYREVEVAVLPHTRRPAPSRSPPGGFLGRRCHSPLQIDASLRPPHKNAIKIDEAVRSLQPRSPPAGGTCRGQSRGGRTFSGTFRVNADGDLFAPDSEEEDGGSIFDLMVPDSEDENMEDEGVDGDADLETAEDTNSNGSLSVKKEEHQEVNGEANLADKNVRGTLNSGHDEIVGKEVHEEGVKIPGGLVVTPQVAARVKDYLKDVDEPI